MIKWVNLELDRNFWRRLKKWNRLAHSPDNVKEVGDWFADLGPQVEQANRGNVEPLRKALPKYAKFIKPPKLGRGQRFPKIRDANLVTAAVEDVKRIRALWKKHYKKQNRHAADGPSAEEIAADRWEVDIEALKERLKRSR